LPFEKSPARRIRAEAAGECSAEEWEKTTP
jgi:hypothetical protein